MKKLIEKYAKYNLWANTKLIEFVKKIDAPLLEKELVSSFKTIRLTLYHIWDAEFLWYNRLHGKSFSDWPSKNITGSIDEFIKMFLEQSAKFVEYTQAGSETELLADFTYHSMEGKEFTNSVTDTILHCMNHSTFHRGQIVTMLRNVGFTELSSTDYITYIREK